MNARAKYEGEASMNARQTPYSKGWDAYHDHGDFGRNPYRTHAARVRWCEGFKAARAEQSKGAA